MLKSKKKKYIYIDLIYKFKVYTTRGNQTRKRSVGTAYYDFEIIKMQRTYKLYF